MSLEIVPLKKEDLPSIKVFSDKFISKDYFQDQELADIYQRSFAGETMCSFLLKKDEKILGLRLTYPPGNWEKGKGSELFEQKWPHKKNETAYFQTIYLDPDLSGQGWGKKLSQKSIEVLKYLGAKGIVCHSWKESPHNSSNRYLSSLGFKAIAELPEYWRDCTCAICTGDYCKCTAVEMYLDLEAQ